MSKSGMAGAAFNGIGDAIESYFKLRNDRLDRERQSRQDQLGQDRYQLNKKQTEESMAQSRYKTIADVLDNYGGGTISGKFADEVNASPYATALTPHRQMGPEQLPSTMFGPLGMSQQTPGAPGAPGAIDPGVYDIIPSASEKYRSAMAGISSRQGIAAAGNASREHIAQMNLQQRAAALAATQGYRWAALNQQQRLTLMRLAQQQEYQQALIEDRNIDNQAAFERPAANDPFAALFQQLNPGAAPGAPGAPPRRTPPKPITLGGEWEQVK